MRLVLTGEPIFPHGSFVMNTAAEIRVAIADFNAGRCDTTTAWFARLNLMDETRTETPALST